MAFRPISPLHAFFDNQGEPLAGGSLSFTTTKTTTPQDVYSNEALTVSLGPTITLDSAGRTPTDVWGSGSYRIRLYNSVGNLIDEADPVTEEGATGVTFPSQGGNAGEFLTTNGTTLSFAPIREVPDPTGSANKILGTDGTALMWIAKPANGAPGASAAVTNTTTSMKVGDGTTFWMVKRVSDSAPASGGRTTSKAVSFGQTFTAAPVVMATGTIAIITGVGYAPVITVASVTTTGCTVNIDVNADQSGANINVPVTFELLVFGTVA